MEKIHDICEEFDFSKLKISNPISKPGGYYLLKLSIDNGNSLYIQPHKCSTKNGIIKGKKIYTDLMFNSDNPELMTWLENLETFCQNFIYENRDTFFEGGLELDDIESYFISPLKLYKSGKYYLLRAFMPTIMGKPALKIYDESENEVSIDKIDNTSELNSILEFKGIKCSAKSFQIEIEIKQMMKMEEIKLFTKCIIKPNNGKKDEELCIGDEHIELIVDTDSSPKQIVNEEDNKNEVVIISNPELEVDLKFSEKDTDNNNNQAVHNDNDDNDGNDIQENLGNSENKELLEETDDSILEEFILDPSIIERSEVMEIKEANEVYYKMYREAMIRARLARDLALNSYLEAKNIKNKHMLDESLLDSDDSDLEKDIDLND
jgi:hypothetical protein